MTIKKLSLITIFLLAALNTFAQDTTYFDRDENPTASPRDADFYTVVLRDSSDNNKVTIRQYYLSGQLKLDVYFADYEKRLPEGTFTEYYPQGQPRQIMDYTNGLLNGQIQTYWENGLPKRIDSFRNGKFITGKCFTPEGRETVHTDFRKEPRFRGGTAALMRYLEKEIEYPEKAREEGIEGIVIIDFIVTKEGYIRRATVVQGVNDDLDKEALRVVKWMPKWKPGIEDGEPINVQYTLPIEFNLNDHPIKKHPHTGWQQQLSNYFFRQLR